jgi:hypothetical protein
VSQLIWQQDISSVDEIELVATTMVKELLTSAKVSLTQDEPDFWKVVGYCWKAFNHSLNTVKSVLVGGSPRSTGMAILTQGTFDRQYWDSGLYEGIHNSQDMTLLLAFGIDPVGYLRYLSIVGSMSELAGSNTVMRSIAFEQDEISQEDSEFVYTFCLESILQMENRVGTIVLPEWKGLGTRSMRRIEL